MLLYRGNNDMSALGYMCFPLNVKWRATFLSNQAGIVVLGQRISPHRSAILQFRWLVKTSSLRPHAKRSLFSDHCVFINHQERRGKKKRVAVSNARLEWFTCRSGGPSSSLSRNGLSLPIYNAHTGRSPRSKSCEDTLWIFISGPYG